MGLTSGGDEWQIPEMRHEKIAKLHALTISMLKKNLNRILIRKKSPIKFSFERRHEAQEGHPGQHPGHHQARNSPPCPPRKSQEEEEDDDLDRRRRHRPRHLGRHGGGGAAGGGGGRQLGGRGGGRGVGAVGPGGRGTPPRCQGCE